MATRVLIMGAAGRDFHDFNVCYQDSPDHVVVAFTACQIPNIAGRTYPPALAGPRYPDGIPIFDESALPELVRRLAVDEVVFAYSDVGRNLERMVQGIVIRTFEQRTVETLAAHARIPVINGLTDFTHPCQALADCMTILERRGARYGTRIAFVGDGNNVAHSLTSGAALLGAEMRVAAPRGHEPDARVVAWARAQCAATGGTLALTDDPVEAVTGADVVYTDVWTRMGQESEREDAIFMHCRPLRPGPARRSLPPPRRIRASPLTPRGSLAYPI